MSGSAAQARAAWQERLLARARVAAPARAHLAVRPAPHPVRPLALQRVLQRGAAQVPRAAGQAVRAVARAWVPVHPEQARGQVPVRGPAPARELAPEPVQQAQALAALDPAVPVPVPVPVPVLVDRQHHACMQGLNGPVHAPGPYPCMRACPRAECHALRRAPPHQKTDGPVRSVSTSSARLPSNDQWFAATDTDLHSIV